MFKLKELFNKRPVVSKPLIIAIHGFGRRKTDEFINLKAALSDYEVITPVLFDQTRLDDVYWYNWVSKAEEVVIQAKNQKRDIILIGFSMGGVIASYLASKFEIKQLILIAPAFEYMNITTVSNTVNKALRKKSKDNPKYPPLPGSFTQTFMDVVNNCKDGITKVNCPVTIFTCLNDELIPYTVSIKYYKKIPHQNKQLIIYGDGQHRLLDDMRVKDLCLNTIKEKLSSL